MLTANYTCGLGGGVADAITTPELALDWMRKFERFLADLPPATPVLVAEDAEPGAASQTYNSTDGIVWISVSYLDALNKATSFVAEGPFPVVGPPIPGALKNLGTAEYVLGATRALITGLQMTPSADTTTKTGPRLYSRKAAIGVATGIGMLAVLAGFAIGWARKPGPSSFVYPSP